MAKRESEYEVVNAYEDIVQYNVRQLMRNMDMCTCDKCFADACAIVYNKGYAKFVTTKKGSVMARYTDTNPAAHVDLMVAITEALQIVKHSPAHDPTSNAG